MEIFIFITSIIFLIFFSAIITQLRSITKKIVNVTNEFKNHYDDLLFQLTPQELERLLDNKSFDLRIAKLKEEVANQKNIVKYQNEPAEELDPNVHNLPHSIINDTYDNFPDEEVAR